MDFLILLTMSILANKVKKIFYYKNIKLFINN